MTCFIFLGALLKNAGNDCHLSSDGANPPDVGNNFLLQEPALWLGTGRSRKTYSIWV